MTSLLIVRVGKSIPNTLMRNDNDLNDAKRNLVTIDLKCKCYSPAAVTCILNPFFCPDPSLLNLTHSSFQRRYNVRIIFLPCNS